MKGESMQLIISLVDQLKLVALPHAEQDWYRKNSF